MNETQGRRVRTGRDDDVFYLHSSAGLVQVDDHERLTGYEVIFRGEIARKYVILLGRGGSDINLLVNYLL